MKLWHKGACGDILYSWMYAHWYWKNKREKVGFGVPQVGWYNIDQFHALWELAAAQPYLAWFEEHKDCPSDFVDMRQQVDNPREGGRPSIIRPYFVNNDVPYPGYHPWIHINRFHYSGKYCVLNVTERYRDPGFIWGRVLPAGEIRFIGTQQEFNNMQNHLINSGYGDAANRVVYTPTASFLEAAHQINGAEAFFGNASSCLALAQGLGVKNIYVELDANTRNTCRFGHEKVLNESP